MKAAVLGDNGVEIRDVPKPEPKANEVLIRVRASSLTLTNAQRRARLGEYGCTRTQDEIRAIVRAMRADLRPAVEAGKLSLPIHKTYPLDDIVAALSVMRASQHFGKIVITV